MLTRVWKRVSEMTSSLGYAGASHKEWYEMGCSPRPCAGGHVWTYGGTTTDGRLPEGLPCQCGAMLSHYETCPTCGHATLKGAACD